MKNTFFLILGLLMVSACDIKQQAREIKALADCQYRIYAIDSLTVAGTDVKTMLERHTLNLSNLPALAFGFLNRDIPLQSTLSFEIINPTQTTASIHQFDYELLVNQYELAKGTYDQPITVSAQDTTYVPITLKTNIYSFLANDSLRRQIQSFLTSAQQGVEETATLTIKIKPGILVGDQVIQYPTFISFDKQLSNKLIF